MGGKSGDRVGRTRAVELRMMEWGGGIQKVQGLWFGGTRVYSPTWSLVEEL